MGQIVGLQSEEIKQIAFEYAEKVSSLIIILTANMQINLYNNILDHDISVLVG